MYVVKEQGTERSYAVEKVIEDIPGGGTVAAADFKGDTESVPEGAVVGVDANGLYHLVKTAIIVAGGDATNPFIAKNHEFKVGDLIADGDKVLEISTIDTSNSAYDVLSFDAGVLTNATEGQILWATADAVDTDGGADAAYEYEPVGVTMNTIDLTKANLGAGILVRGRVRESICPYPIPAGVKTALSLIRFV